MGGGAVSRTAEPDQDVLQTFDLSVFSAKLIAIRKKDSVTAKSKGNRMRPSLMSYVQLSRLEKSTLREIALKQETADLKQLICQQYEKLYFEIGEWDSHETLIHSIIGSKKNKNLQVMLQTVLTSHPEHFEMLMNLATSDGETPVITAVMTGSLECLNTLLNAGGVDLQLKDERDQTAETHAQKEKDIDMLELLRKYKPTCRKVNREYVLNPRDMDQSLLKRRSVLLSKASSQTADSVLGDLLKQYPQRFEMRDHQDQADRISKQKKLFVDSEFPAESKTLCDPKDAESSQVPFLSNVVWLRPYQIFNGKDYKLFEDHIAPEDVIQGKPKTCFYLAVYASLAMHPERVREMILNSEVNPYGYYVVRLYINGKRTDVIIDDQFPCMNSNRKAAFCQPNGSELWVMLLEKAWVKSFGYYSKVQSILPEDIIEDLLGVPSYGYVLPKIEAPVPSNTPKPPIDTRSTQFNQVFHQIRDALDSHYLVVAVSGKDVAKDGISPCQSYSVLAAVQLSPTVKLLKVRNSIDSLEWDGEYGDQRLSQQLMSRLNYTSKKDGIFWVTIRQFLEIFVYYSVGYCRSGFTYTYAQFDQPDNKKEGRNIYYHFTLKRKQKVNIRLIQSFSKYLQQKNYMESPAILTTVKLPDRMHSQPRIVASGCRRSFTGHKSIHFDSGIFKELEEGEYLIHVRVKWHQATNPSRRQAVVGVYCEETDPLLTRVDPRQGDRHLLSAYFAEAVAKGRQYKFAQSQGFVVYEYAWKQNRKIYAVDSTTTDGTAILQFRATDFENCQVDFGRIDSDQLKMRVPYRSIGTLQRKDPSKPMKATLMG